MYYVVLHDCYFASMRSCISRTYVMCDSHGIVVQCAVVIFNVLLLHGDLHVKTCVYVCVTATDAQHAFCFASMTWYISRTYVISFKVSAAV